MVPKNLPDLSENQLKGLLRVCEIASFEVRSSAFPDQSTPIREGYVAGIVNRNNKTYLVFSQNATPNMRIIYPLLIEEERIARYERQETKTSMSRLA